LYHGTLLVPGYGINQVNIRGTTGAIIVLSALGGQDVVTVGSLAPSLGGTLDSIQGSVTIWDQTQTALTLDDSGDISPRNVTLDFDGTYHAVSGLAPAAILYRPGTTTSGVSRLTVNAGSGGNTFNVQQTAAGTPVTLNAGSGSDIVKVGGTANSLDGLQGPLTVNGVDSKTMLNINDQGTNTSKTYNLIEGEFTRATLEQPAVVTESITFHGLASLVARGGTGTNTFFVDGTPADTTVSLYGGIAPAGTYVYDQFIVGFGPSGLDSIQGPLGLHGQTSLSYPLLYDYKNPIGHAYTLTSDRVRRSDMADISFDGMVQMILYTSLNGADTVNVESVATDVFTPIVVGAGDNITLGRPVVGGRSLQEIRGSVRPQTYGNGSVAVVVDDSGDISPRQATFSYDPANRASGHVLSGLAPAPIYFILDATDSLLVKGGVAADSFQLPINLPTVPMTLSGGGGTNVLDYSSFTTGVIVNLQAGKATAVSGGVANFANILGGAGNDILIGNGTANEIHGGMGNDILVGGDGDDTLFGDAGRDLLIGGLGADLLDGGTGDDVLLGGYTSYDTQVASNGSVGHVIDLNALRAIMSEWANGDSPSLSTQENYKTRISHLRGGGGLNGSSLLNNKTVFDDGAIDRLFGSDGFDWFLVNKKQDSDSRVAPETETSI
jgi:hypothetical protein